MSYNNMLIPGMPDLGEGQGLWPHAYVNHSYIPSVRHSFAGNMLVFRAIHDIAAGEKTTISYIHTLEAVRDRREMLQTGLELHCECSLCLLEAKTATDMLEGRQRLIEEWRLVHRKWGAEIGGGKSVNIEGLRLPGLGTSTCGPAGPRKTGDALREDIRQERVREST